MTENRIYQLKLFIAQGLKFSFVGVLNTVIGFGTVFVLTNFFKTSYEISIAIGNILGFINSFIWNKYFTFNVKKFKFIEVILFILVFVGSTLIQIFSYILLDKSIKHIFYIFDNSIKLSFLLSMIIYTFIFFLGSKFITFNKTITNS